LLGAEAKSCFTLLMLTRHRHVGCCQS
jgi:hypothetical protein